MPCIRTASHSSKPPIHLCIACGKPATRSLATPKKKKPFTRHRLALPLLLPQPTKPARIRIGRTRIPIYEALGPFFSKRYLYQYSIGYAYKARGALIKRLPQRHTALPSPFLRPGFFRARGLPFSSSFRPFSFGYPRPKFTFDSLWFALCFHQWLRSFFEGILV